MVVTTIVCSEIGNAHMILGVYAFSAKIINLKYLKT
jgi:hypothetical protein